MKLSTVAKAFSSLCLLLADGLTGDASPEIIGPDHIQIKAHPGQLLCLHCEAFTKSAVDVTLIYWLVNGSFPEETDSHGRISESEESSLDEGAILQRSLLLKNVTTEDLKSTFTCVVINSAGMAQKNIKLAATGSDCYVRKKRKC